VLFRERIVTPISFLLAKSQGFLRLKIEKKLRTLRERTLEPKGLKKMG